MLFIRDHLKHEGTKRFKIKTTDTVYFPGEHYQKFKEEIISMLSYSFS